jgi:short-subunit dehydrogenase
MKNISTKRTILITGASGSIGSALARAYASPGMTLVIHGRNEQALSVVAADCESAGAKVVMGVFDITDTPQLQAWVQDIDFLYPIDLAIVNQGMNIHIGLHGEAEPWAQVDRLLDVNLRATMALTYAVISAMRLRGKGQIALMSSLAGYFGLPLTPAYSSSKAAVKAYGEALRGWLQPYGIQVSVVMPGYVKSDMCDAMPGPKPFLWSADRAARIIKKRLIRNHARISFPFPLNLGCWFLSVLPASISLKILGWMGYRV